MSSVELPIWLVVLFTVLALGAPSVAAWVHGSIMSKRANKLWERESDLQAQRWHREYRRERDFKVFEERKSAYVEAIGAASAWSRYLIEWQNDLVADSRAEPRHDKLSQLAEEAFHATATVELLGDSHVGAGMRKVNEILGAYGDALSEWTPDKDYAKKLNAIVANACVALQELRDAARRDIEALLPLTPTPPFALTP